MGLIKTYKCGNKYCKNNNIVNRDIAIKIGTRYHCPECAKEVDGKREIREIYMRDIDVRPNMTQLNLAIKKIINEYGCDVDLVLYAFKYIKRNNIKINSPFGLTWVVKDGKMLNEYKKDIVAKKANELRRDIDTENTTETNSFSRKTSSKPKWMIDI